MRRTLSSGWKKMRRRKTAEEKAQSSFRKDFLYGLIQVFLNVLCFCQFSSHGDKSEGQCRKQGTNLESGAQILTSLLIQKQIVRDKGVEQ